MQTPEYSLTRRTLCPARAYSMVYQKLCRGQRRQDGMRRVLKASTMRKLSKRRVGRRHFAQRKIMIPYIFSQPVMFSCHPPPPRHLEVGRPSILDLPPHIYCVCGTVSFYQLDPDIIKNMYFIILGCIMEIEKSRQGIIN